MVNFIITPEAIAELIFEIWHEEKEECYSHQVLILEESRLYYLGMSYDNANDMDTLAKIKKEDYEFVKKFGNYQKLSYSTLRSDIRHGENLLLIDNIIKYLQLKEIQVEDYIIDNVKKYLPKKLLRHRNIEILY